MSVTFVAEVSSNHNQDLSRCFKFIDAAADVGCGAVKFQLFKVKELFAPEILAKSEEHRKREAWELPVEFLPQLAERCREAGVQFACTPFYLDAVDELLPHVDFFKVASYELLWDDLLVAVAQTGKPVVLSTGMATLSEVQHAVQVIADAGCRDLTLLHCVSGYPTSVAECNLAAIETIRTKICNPQSPIPNHQSNMTLRVGWSDHSVNPGVICRAVHRWGAAMVEFHLDLDGKGKEFQMGHCWLPEQVRPVIEAVRVTSEADGDGEKRPVQSELPDRDWRADPSDGLRPLLPTRQEWTA